MNNKLHKESLFPALKRAFNKEFKEPETVFLKVYTNKGGKLLLQSTVSKRKLMKFMGK